MNKGNFTSIIAELERNASSVQYGIAGVELQIHQGQIVGVTYVKTEKEKKAVTL